jgi:hypothetical protein
VAPATRRAPFPASMSGGFTLTDRRLTVFFTHRHQLARAMLCVPANPSEWDAFRKFVKHAEVHQFF